LYTILVEFALFLYFIIKNEAANENLDFGHIALFVYAPDACALAQSENPITQLIETLKNDDRVVRAEAINALLQLGPIAIYP